LACAKPKPLPALDSITAALAAPQMASVFTRAKNLASAAFDFAADGFTLSGDQLTRARLAICQTCDQKSGNWCAKCGCQLAAKAAIRSQSCPLGKWEHEENASKQSQDDEQAHALGGRSSIRHSSFGTGHSVRSVTFGVTAFERPRHLERLVASIRRFYPAARVIVADNGRQKAVLNEAAAGGHVEVLDLPYDCGLSAARHALVQRLTTPYFLLLEEDFVFTAETTIEPLVDILDHDGQLGAVGGSVRVNGAVHDYAIDLSVFRGTLEGAAARGPLRFSPGGTPYRLCDQHNNFGLWRREMLLEPDHSWLGLPKVGEHAAYFWRIKLAGRWRVAHAPTVIVGHDLSGRDSNYQQHRARAGTLQKAWLAAQGIPGGYKQDPSLAVSSRLARPPERPNLLILGVGHSGTSIVAKMLFAAGWHAGDADAEFGESVSVRALNESLAGDGQLNAKRAAAALAALAEPWALKDPRFVYTLPAWLRHFAALERPPLLVWLRREARQVAASYVRRGELTADRSLAVVSERLARCEKLFELWPWARLAIDYERLADAAKLFR
jgi:hypothetical protein